MKTLATAAFALMFYSGVSQATASFTYHFQSFKPADIENFYCIVKNGADKDRVVGFNYAEMVKGFTKNGMIDSDVATLNQYAFAAYHDKNYPNNLGSVTFKVDNSSATIYCMQGTDNRPLIGGDFG